MEKGKYHNSAKQTKKQLQKKSLIIRKHSIKTLPSLVQGFDILAHQHERPSAKTKLDGSNPYEQGDPEFIFVGWEQGIS
jgi:hypothetical protein